MILWWNINIHGSCAVFILMWINKYYKGGHRRRTLPSCALQTMGNMITKHFSYTWCQPVLLKEKKTLTLFGVPIAKIETSFTVIWSTVKKQSPFQTCRAALMCKVQKLQEMNGMVGEKISEGMEMVVFKFWHDKKDKLTLLGNIWGKTWNETAAQITTTTNALHVRNENRTPVQNKKQPSVATAVCPFWVRVWFWLIQFKPRCQTRQPC